MRRDGRRNDAVIWAGRLLLVTVVVLAWEWSVGAELLAESRFGQPSAIARAFIDYLGSERAAESLASTAIAVGLAFVIGSTTGVIAGLLLGLYRSANAIVGFFLTPLNSVPRIALAPIFIALFGLTTSAKVALAVTIVFFILAENARSAVQSVDQDQVTMARIVGFSDRQILWKVVIPSAVPTLFAGLRLTYTYSLLGVVASEMIAASSGVGQDLVFFGSSYQISSVFAVLILLLCVGMVVSGIFTLLEKRLLRWQGT